MRGRICDLLNKHQRIIKYLIFGGLTTAVNYFVYYPLYNVADFSAAVSNGISWIAAVIFAFFTNKAFVFESRNWSREVLVPEFFKFLGCRLASGVSETVILFVLVDMLDFNGNIWKIMTSILVVILNYLFSKLIVFKYAHQR